MSKIRNFAVLATSSLRRAVLEALETGLAAIDTKAVIQNQVKKLGENLNIAGEVIPRANFDRLLVIGIGKCSSAAAAALEVLLGDWISGGIVVDVRCAEKLKYIKGCEGTHPYPSDQNINFTREIIELLKTTTERDLVLMIVSGGGSTLLCQPDNHTCQDETAMLEGLFRAGASIREINTIRKHLSRARGGHLAEYAYPARVISLIFSDVVDNDLSTISSGPTVKDETTVAEALSLAKKYGLALEGQLFETPKDDKFFARVTNHLVVSNLVMLEAMAAKGRELGFESKVCSHCLAGEARVVGENIARELGAARGKTMFLYGGETTVTLRNSAGRGGRNRELALSALPRLKPGQVLAALATDGKDFTDRAGAIVDTGTLERARKMNIDPAVYSRDNNSHAFFEQLGDYLDTGLTGSNVADIIVAAKE